MLGPGKYDAETAVLRESTGAALVVACVIRGRLGHGFSLQVDVDRMPDISPLPAMLRGIADQIEQDLRELNERMARERGKGRD